MVRVGKERAGEKLERSSSVAPAAPAPRRALEPALADRFGPSRVRAQHRAGACAPAPTPRALTPHAPAVGTRRPAAPPQLQLLERGFALPAAPAPAPAPTVSSARRAFDALPVSVVDADIRLLSENDEAWLATWRTLDEAPSFVDASYFIFERDVFGMAYLGKLLEKANAGQPVRLLIDAIGDAFGHRGFTKTGLGQDYLQELVETGSAEVRVYHPVLSKLLGLLRGGGERFSSLGNNHDKLLRTARSVVTGGRNVSKAYFTRPEDASGVYVDCDVLLRGEDAARAFREPFDREWTRADLHHEVKKNLLGNWRRRDVELLGASAMMDAWLQAPTSPEVRARLRRDPAAREKEVGPLVEAAMARLPSLGVTRPPNGRERRALQRLATSLVEQGELRGANLGDGARATPHRRADIKVLDRASAAVDAEDHLGPGLAALAESAEKRILLHNPYVVLTEGALAALEAAGQRGVQIDLLTNSPDSTDSLLTQAFFLEDWPRILARVPNMRIFALTGDQKLHAKVATVDDEISVVGSYNLDLLSEQINGELATVSADPSLALRVRARDEKLRKDPAQGVVEYTIERDARGRPVLEDGQPRVRFGPEQHMSTWARLKYAALRGLVRLGRRLPALRAISGIALPPT